MGAAAGCSRRAAQSTDPTGDHPHPTGPGSTGGSPVEGSLTDLKAVPYGGAAGYLTRA